ncbi:hypothetical protein C7974DRAFT_443656 [Boeremia exigua]|uniref:uncharacterized protein n=1 Tax=Boeremia exigua TaxID=749465 RepID=UPI001E8DB061|nr:uncharacterized protein C7974DRAFT_443656 [Boeremia exigua]KAH6615379.1 hypothetical protein C7974DRAFT_443656 [Boeremia exigua]
MVVIAIAGGAGGLGRTIAEVVIRQRKHQVKILSRSSNPKLAAEIGCEIIPVDYDNIESMTKILEDNKIDTVISTIFLTTSATPQNNLALAADASKVTRRFVPSIWGVPITPEQATGFVIGQVKLEGLEVLKKTSLEHTRFYMGFFLDYWGYPRVPTYQTPMIMAIDIENEGSSSSRLGEHPGLWDEQSYILGEKVTWSEFVKIAEEVKGKKFKVTHDSLEFLSTGKVTELPCHSAIYPVMPKEDAQGLMSLFGRFFHDGLFNLSPEKTLNQIFPDIKVLTVRDVLERGWGGVEETAL